MASGMLTWLIAGFGITLFALLLGLGWEVALFSVAFTGIGYTVISYCVAQIVRLACLQAPDTLAAAGALGIHRLSFSKRGLREVGPSMVSRCGWDALQDVQRDGDHIFITLTTGQVAIVNRHSYEGPVAFYDLPRAIGQLAPQAHAAARLSCR
jgi:hypothetical protein